MNEQITYSAEIVPPERDTYGAKYHVDLVRASVDADGIAHEQRLTVGQHDSWMEAEEQHTQIETAFSEAGVNGWGEDGERLYLAATYPPDAPAGRDSTANLLAISADGITSATLAVGDRESVERVVEQFDRFSAGMEIDPMLESAQNDAEFHGNKAPRPDYYFGYGVGESNKPSLEAVKTWVDGDERRFDTLTIREYDDYDDAEVDEYILERSRVADGVEKAMHVAERWAEEAGYLDPDREDRRIFFADDAPTDPFKSLRELEQPEYSVSAISANGESFLDVMKTWGEDGYERLTIPMPTWEDAHFHAEVAFGLQANDDLQGAMRHVATLAEDAGVIERDDPRLFRHGPPDAFTINDVPFEDDPHLLHPLDDVVNYGVKVADIDAETIALRVEKYWDAPKGDPGFQAQIIQTYDAKSEHGRDQAEADQAYLLELHADKGLEATLNRAESMAVENGHLDANRADPRLFTQGPLDAFETIREREIDGDLARHGVTWRETQEWETSGDRPYWRMETLPVNDPNGEPLGHALHMVVYDGVLDDPARIGAPAMREDEPFRMLEVAHFETVEAADKFGKEFKGYLMPGLLDGPELAEEVARLEGHPVEWKTLEGQALDAYRDLSLTLTRDESAWKPYNPHAERDARMEAENIEPATPDFDL